MSYLQDNNQFGNIAKACITQNVRIFTYVFTIEQDLTFDKLSILTRENLTD